MDIINLKAADHFINRELSQLEFNRRVLCQAQDETLPILERLKYLCIVSTNLDEFFEIRVGGLQQREEAGSGPPGPDMLSPQQILAAIHEQARILVTEQYRLLNTEIIPALAKEGVNLIRRSAWTEKQRRWLHDYFQREVVPTLSPIALDTARPFPRILNKSLNFVVGLEGLHAFGRPCHRAIVQAPRSLPRLIQLPSELSDAGNNDFVFLSSIIHAFVDELFSGMKITGCYQFRVTRNSDLYVDAEEVDNLIRALEGKLAASRYGAAVRLEIADDCPRSIIENLLNVFELKKEDLYRVDGPVNLNRLMTVYDLTHRDDLKYPPFTPGLPRELLEAPDIFALLKHQDLLLNHPYESFDPVMEFVSRAANDSKVVAIKLTLYRTAQDSAIIDHLVAAAQAGKEVTVCVELRARFDEAINIGFANRLQEVGAHVVYGIVGFKTHCKMAMVVRRETNGLRRYAHLGTGNYHPGTARVYVDYSLLTANEEITEDVHQVFLQLTGMMQTPPLNKLIQAPFKLHSRLIEMIEREATAASRGADAHIIAKLNALIEPEIIMALYRASVAGVKIQLIVRGICA
ncbi:MAG: polyphosphate kinase 1, partial [Gammaproteobacteria bacterium]